MQEQRMPNRSNYRRYR
ncbi:hypothetical protein Gotur_034028 [Gossypium turneri]